MVEALDDGDVLSNNIKVMMLNFDNDKKVTRKRCQVNLVSLIKI